MIGGMWELRGVFVVVRGLRGGVLGGCVIGIWGIKRGVGKGIMLGSSANGTGS
ncbi:hypothetical protein [Bacillus mycoides]|uniref:hypothetical protein n=1 Tax=Bacillus mycoides TaxID=1405 RepID=UPI003CC7FE01